MKSTWNPRAGVTVYRPGERTLRQVAEGEYTLSVTPAATVDATGELTVSGDSGDISLSFTLAQQQGGTVAVNAWTAFGFLTPTATWGAYPGGTVDDAPSGIGIVHNAFLLDRVERTVVRGPFRPFPRSATSAVRGYGLSVLPKPPWFVTSRTGAAVCEGFTRFRIDGDWAKMSVVLVKAFGA